MIFSSGSISSTFSPGCTRWWQQGLEKGSREKLLSPKASLGAKKERPRLPLYPMEGARCAPGTGAAILVQNAIPLLSLAGAGSGSGCLPHQQLSVQGGFWIGTVGNRGFYRPCHNCIRYHENILKKPYYCTDFNKSVNPRENGIKMQVF